MVQTSLSVPARLSAVPSASVEELRSILAERAERQYDRIVDVNDICMDEGNGRIRLGDEEHRISGFALGQLAVKLGIPVSYLRRCDPDLRAYNVNRWLKQQNGDLLLRMEGKTLRAVLSTRYKPLNHLDLVERLERELSADTSIRYELTSLRLELQIVEHNAASNGGDPLHPGLHITNSEVGAAALSFLAMIYRTICLNGLIMGGEKYEFSRKHIGNIDLEGMIQQQLAMRISVQGSEIVGKFGSLRSIRIPEPTKVINRIADRYELTQDQRDQVLVAFNVEPGDSLYHAVNALTRAGNSDSLSLESRRSLQELGGRLVETASSGRRWLD